MTRLFGAKNPAQSLSLPGSSLVTLSLRGGFRMAFNRNGLAPFLFTCGLLLVSALSATAQEKPPKLPEPEDINRETKDGVALKMTYFAGTHGKKSVPLILLHGWDGQRGDMEALALRLQSLGHAVVTLDLRGHGQSMKYKAIEKGEIVYKDLDRNTFRPVDVQSMTQDIETAKRFLLEKNNAGECNIEALGIVACDVSCLLAMRWSILDWSAPVLPSFKQGQDVKALVLLSPVNSFKGLSGTDFMANQSTRKFLSIMLVAGNEESKSLGEAKRLQSKLQQFHPKPSGDRDLDRKNLDLFLVTPDTQLQGSKLLSRALVVNNNIANFLSLRLVEKQDQYSWSDRKNPLE
ncbi:Alpha/beta hydrolase family protein [Anatilimnocola aggregata]|uniref:Alpha/beta hydrolase family protein n=1 Tax=Anatilimnocola aggregata TaxID=2528021 RepID=A0A517YFW1_9BACT|nr:alpha/beta hydrolase [Anatilimnocola aggregata]QDU29116.1 Alpha/beta hydrolase family protein [Anatilimnocola aggregata]